MKTTTLEDLAKRLRKLSREMLTVGTMMDYYGGLDVEMAVHGQEMICASVCMRSYADAIDAKVEAKAEKETP
jgi:hypothetical protein